MYVATHVTMGALIGQNIPTPGLAFLLGAVSHFMLDMVPHGDSKLYHNYKKGDAVTKSLIYVTIDSIFSIFLFIYLLEVAPYANRTTIIMGVFGSVVPDMLVALGEAFPIRPLLWFQRKHIAIHDSIVSRVGNVPLKLGIVLQCIILALAVALVKR